MLLSLVLFPVFLVFYTPYLYRVESQRRDKGGQKQPRVALLERGGREGRDGKGRGKGEREERMGRERKGEGRGRGAKVREYI
jgi:hypothetical protein